jgi:hypothetical protein
VAGLLVPIIFLVPALVFCILQYQLVERLVCLCARSPSSPAPRGEWTGSRCAGRARGRGLYMHVFIHT